MGFPSPRHGSPGLPRDGMCPVGIQIWGLATPRWPRGGSVPDRKGPRDRLWVGPDRDGTARSVGHPDCISDHGCIFVMRLPCPGQRQGAHSGGSAGVGLRSDCPLSCFLENIVPTGHCIAQRLVLAADPDFAMIPPRGPIVSVARVWLWADSSSASSEGCLASGKSLCMRPDYLCAETPIRFESISQIIPYGCPRFTYCFCTVMGILQLFEDFIVAVECAHEIHCTRHVQEKGLQRTALQNTPKGTRYC